MLLGGLILGHLGDNFGRRWSLILSIFINTVFSFASGIVDSLTLVILFRGLAGLGIGGSIPPIFAYTSEIIIAKWRDTFVTFIGYFWMLGTIVTSLLAIVII